ncbi:MAG: helix-turn-helix transcriptional regulator [Bacteroidetes bacterium]|nr:helix-turn-helix transcriptional regulator [Bacteroidota bacterium]
MIERINELIEKLELTPSKFADEIGVPRSTISHLVSGRNKPSLDFIMKIAERFPETDINWIIFGKGSAIKTERKIEIVEQTANKPAIKQEASIKPQVPDLFSFADEIVEKQKSIAKDEESVEYHTTQRRIQPDEKEVLDKASSVNQSEIEKVIILYKDKTFVEYRLR